MKKKFGLIGLMVFVFLLFSCTTEYGRLFDNQTALLAEEDQYYYRIRNGNFAPGMEFRDYSGIDTVWILEAEKNSWFSCSYNLNIEKGQFKLILVTPTGEIYNIAQRSEGEVKTYEIPAGINRIRIVGAKTTGEIEAFLEVGENVKKERAPRFSGF